DFLKHISNRINTIAEDLLDKNQISNVVSCKSVYGVIRNVVKEKRALYNSKVEFRLKNSNKVSTDSIHIKFNEADFARVLSNLINNSIEAIDKSKGLIEISCQANEDSLSITIRDNGIGMSEEVLSNLGKRGFSTGKKSSDSGSGIGVSSAIDILKAYGSTFQLNSQLSIGTEIEINIPYCGQN